MSRALISIVLPVQDEGAAICDSLRRLEQALAGEAHEILVCHGVDAQRTLAAIAAMPDRPPGLRVLRGGASFRGQSVLPAGLAAAQGDVVLTLGALLDDPLERIPRMAERVRAGADAVAGTRAAHEEWDSRASRLALRAFGGLRLDDPPGGFCAYSRRFVELASRHVPERAGVPLHDQAWFWRALAPGLASMLSFLVCLLAAGWLAGRGADAGLESMPLALLGLACAGVLGFTRWVSGRTTRWDALHPVLLLLLPSIGNLGLCLGASAALALASCGKDALRRRFRAAPARAAPGPAAEPLDAGTEADTSRSNPHAGTPATSPEVRRSGAMGWLALAGVLAVWVTMSCWCWTFVERYASPIPHLDDLELAVWVAPEAQISWESYWAQANEHRIVIPRLVYLALLGITRDFRSAMFFQVAVLSLLALGLIFAARRLRGTTTLADAFFPLALLHWGNYNQLMLGMQITIVVPIALVMLFVLIALRRAGPPAALAAAGMIACLLLLPLNGGFGLMQLPPLLLFALACGWVQVRKRSAPERWAGILLLLGSLAAGALIYYYFIEFRFPPGSERVFSPFSIVKTAVRFLSLNIGPIGWFHPTFVPLLALVLPLATMLVLVRAWRGAGAERWRIASLGAGLASAATIAAAIGVARSSDGGMAGLADRYVILPAAWYLCAYLALCRFGPRWIAHVLQHAVAITIALLLPLYVRLGTYHGELRTQESNSLQADVLQKMDLAEVVERHWNGVYTSPEGFRARLLLLRRAGYPPFRGIGADGEKLADVSFFQCSPAPLRVVAPEPTRARRLFGLETLTLRADAEIVLPVPPGATLVESSYGMVPNGWDAPATAKVSDGLRFRVELRPPGGTPRVLFERELHPRENLDDRGLQRLHVDVPADAVGELALVTRNISGKHQPYDWAFWGPIALR